MTFREHLTTISVLLLLTLTPMMKAWAEEPSNDAVWSQPANPSLSATLSFTDLDGKNIPLADLGGSIVILHFWATWCAPCVAELPALDRLAARMASRGVVVVAVSEDRGGSDDVRPFLSKHPELPHVRMMLDAHRTVAKALSLGIVPVSVVLNADGRERGRLTGSGEWDSPETQTKLEAILR